MSASGHTRAQSISANTPGAREARPASAKAPSITFYGVAASEAGGAAAANAHYGRRRDSDAEEEEMIAAAMAAQ